MKKHLLSLLLVLFSFTIYAQNNWNASYYQNYIEISTHGNYTWTSDGNQVYKINNTTLQTEVLFDTLKNQSDIRGLTSRNDNAWFSFRDKNNRCFIRHYKSDGTYVEINPTDFTTTSINSYLDCALSTSNLDGSKAYFINHYNDYLLYFRDHKPKKIILPKSGNYNIFKYIDDNTLLIRINQDKFYQLIDTNGVQKKKINANTLGITNIDNYIFDVDVDESKNIYFAVKNIGIIKMNCNSPDTNITTIIPYSALGNSTNGHNEVRYTADNNILILNGTIASIYNINGIYQYNVPYLQEQFSFYYGANFTINNQHELITTTGHEPIRYSGGSWIDLFERRNNLQSQYRITNTAFSADGTNLFGNSRNMFYRNKSNIISSVLNDPDPFIYAYINSSITDRNDNIWFVKNGKLYELINNDTDLEYLPLPSNLSFTSTPPSNYMDVTFDNKIQYLSGKHISSYTKYASSWVNYSIPTNSTITSLYSLANDNNNTTWVATDKGIASINNNNIELNTTVNENSPVGCIRYLKNSNSLIYTYQYDYSKFVIYNLSTNTKTIHNFPSTFQSNTEVILISIDKNDQVWFTSSLSGAHRFNTQTMSFDLNFKASNSIMKDSNVYYIAVDNENNKLFFCGNYSVIYYYNENGVALNTNFIQAKHNDLSIYPNPTSGLLTIDSKENYTAYFIYNLLGRLLKNGEIENKKINISELSSGVYTLKLVGNKGESIRKIIKN